ncbi:MAG: type II 3-dehydroquinate dehydratase [bacterium]|nr:type II 3-dehydroquinate dehydratase [bacterium]
MILHGPNLNLLGRREPEKYGHTTLAEIDETLRALAAELGLEVEIVQSNHEGVLIDTLHGTTAGAVIINAGALTHYSYALADALRSIDAYKIEVHMTNVFAREEFRHHSVISPVVDGAICGFGMNSYTLGLRMAAEALKVDM